MSESNLNTLSTHIEMKKVWQLLGIVAITAIVWNLPISVFDIDGLTVVQQRIIAIFCFCNTIVAHRMYSSVGNIVVYYDHYVHNCIRKFV